MHVSSANNDASIRQVVADRLLISLRFHECKALTRPSVSANWRWIDHTVTLRHRAKVPVVSVDRVVGPAASVTTDRWPRARRAGDNTSTMDYAESRRTSDRSCLGVQADCDHGQVPLPMSRVVRRVVRVCSTGPSATRAPSGTEYVPPRPVLRNAGENSPGRQTRHLPALSSTRCAPAGTGRAPPRVPRVPAPGRAPPGLRRVPDKSAGIPGTGFTGSTMAGVQRGDTAGGVESWPK